MKDSISKAAGRASVENEFLELYTEFTLRLSFQLFEGRRASAPTREAIEVSVKRKREAEKSPRGYHLDRIFRAMTC